MDEIQKVLVKEGRKDLAQKYYLLISGKKPGIPDGTGPMKDDSKCPYNKEKDIEKKSVYMATSEIKNLYSLQKNMADLSKKINKNIEDLTDELQNGVSKDNVNKVNRMLKITSDNEGFQRKKLENVRDILMDIAKGIKMWS